MDNYFRMNSANITRYKINSSYQKPQINPFPSLIKLLEVTDIDNRNNIYFRITID